VACRHCAACAGWWKTARHAIWPPSKSTTRRPKCALTAAINSLLEEVNKQVDQQRRFIGDAAHQLRTPLAGLKSQTELVKAELQGQTPDIPRACRQLEQVETSVARSIHLVNQLLALARAEPETGLQRSVLDLNQLTREVTAEAVPRALARGLDLGLDSGDEKC
jgi:two-component system sensor histidine kinase TctE